MKMGMTILGVVLMVAGFSLTYLGVDLFVSSNPSSKEFTGIADGAKETADDAKEIDWKSLALTSGEQADEYRKISDNWRDYAWRLEHAIKLSGHKQEVMDAFPASLHQ